MVVSCYFDFLVNTIIIEIHIDFLKHNALT
jgi:hypothetical protein